MWLSRELSHRHSWRQPRRLIKQQQGMPKGMYNILAGYPVQNNRKACWIGIKVRHVESNQQQTIMHKTWRIPMSRNWELNLRNLLLFETYTCKSSQLFWYGTFKCYVTAFSGNLTSIHHLEMRITLSHTPSSRYFLGNLIPLWDFNGLISKWSACRASIVAKTPFSH